MRAQKRAQIFYGQSTILSQYYFASFSRVWLKKKKMAVYIGPLFWSLLHLTIDEAYTHIVCRSLWLTDFLFSLLLLGVLLLCSAFPVSYNNKAPLCFPRTWQLKIHFFPFFFTPLSSGYYFSPFQTPFQVFTWIYRGLCFVYIVFCSLTHWCIIYI